MGWLNAFVGWIRRTLFKSCFAKKTFAEIAKMAVEIYGIEINVEKAIRLDTKDLGTIMFAPPKSPLFRDYSEVEQGVIIGAVYADLTKKVYTYADEKSRIKIPKGAYLLKATGKLGEWIPTEYVDKEGKVVAETNQIYIRKLPSLNLFKHVKEPIAASMEFPGSVVFSVYCANEFIPEFVPADADATYVNTSEPAAK